MRHHTSWLAAGCGEFALVIAVTAAGEPRPAHAGTSMSVAAALASGTLRELVCRGREGLDLRIEQDPSLRNPQHVSMTLRYQRSVEKTGEDYRELEPGACTWNPLGWPDVPAEPGRVLFDVAREAQPWSATGTRWLDTTLYAAAFFPDPVTLPRYLGQPDHLWVFYADDASDVAISFGAFRAPVTKPTLVSVTGTVGAELGGRQVAGNAATADVATVTGERTTDRSRTTSSAVRTASASSARLGTSALDSARSRRARALDSGIISVVVLPGPLGVRLRFNTDIPGARPTVQFSTRPPTWDERGGRWSYPEGWSGPWYASIERFVLGSSYEAVPLMQLESGVRQYYLITVEGEPATTTRQRTGSFTAAEGP